VTPENLKTRIAQTHLKESGQYKAKIDGDWGPLSRAAALKWWRDKTPSTAGTPYELAQSYVGTREIPGAEDNPLIVSWLRMAEPWVSDDETAWCSAFVGAMAELTGYETTGKLNARSWLEAGDGIELRDARPGDVAVFWRSSPASWKGHVGFFVEQDGDKIKVLGGNQGNKVSIASYPRTRLLGVRRIKKS